MPELRTPPTWLLPRANRSITTDRPLIMGILNVNDDSFCGDGTLEATGVAYQTRALLEAGADIIDVGAESARTNRQAVPIEEEIRRFHLFFDVWRDVMKDGHPPQNDTLSPPLLSLNTWRHEVVEAILPLGGDLLNDMSGAANEANARACARHGVSLLVMHTVGEPKQAHTDRQWQDVVADVEAFFEQSLARATACGLPREAVVLDPGLDFAKQKEDNLELMRHLPRLTRFGRPILLPVSRKTFIGETLGLDNPLDRDPGTLACIAAAMTAADSGWVFRVHNVSAARAACRMLHAVAHPESAD